MQIARIVLAIVVLSWAGWELFDYWFVEPGRKAFAQECRDGGKIVVTGPHGAICR